MKPAPPSPSDFVTAPELTVLFLLEAALTAARAAVYAAHPELHCTDANGAPLPMTSDSWCAKHVLALVEDLSAALHRYRAAAEHQRAIELDSLGF